MASGLMNRSKGDFSSVNSFGQSKTEVTDTTDIGGSLCFDLVKDCVQGGFHVWVLDPFRLLFVRLLQLGDVVVEDTIGN